VLAVDGATLAGLILGVLGILIGLLTYWLSRRPKLLGYSFEQWIPLLKGPYPDLEIRYQGEVVQNPHVFLIKIINYGKVEIRPDDFMDKEPLTISFSDLVVDASAISGQPGTVAVNLLKGAHDFAFEPVLLNPGERIVVSGLADKITEVSTHRVEGRLAGVKRVKNLDDVGRLAFFDRRTFSRIMYATAAIGGLALGVTTDNVAIMIATVVAFTATFTFLLFASDLARWRNRRRFSR